MRRRHMSFTRRIRLKRRGPKPPLPPPRTTEYYTRSIEVGVYTWGMGGGDSERERGTVTRPRCTRRRGGPACARKSISPHAKRTHARPSRPRISRSLASRLRRVTESGAREGSINILCAPSPILRRSLHHVPNPRHQLHYTSPPPWRKNRPPPPSENRGGRGVRGRTVKTGGWRDRV